MSRLNLLTVLGVHRKEDVISNLLAHCYNGSMTLRPHLLRALEVPQTEALLKGHAYTRVGVGDSGVPDVVIVGRQPNEHALLVIENKLDAEEGNEQTERYASPECRAQLEKRWNLAPSLAQASYRYLTLFPGEKPKAKAFQPVSYRSFLSIDWDGAHDPSSWAAEFMSAWLQLLRGFYESADLAPDEDFLAALGSACENELESSFLLFCRFMESLHLPRGLFLQDTQRQSRTGRRYYLAHLRKKSWAPKEMFREGRKWRLDPGACFDIHIQPQYDVLGRKFVIYLHYETNPYHPLKWLENKDNLDSSDYAAYARRRNDFAQCFRSHVPGEMKLRGRNNQIGVIPCAWEGLSVASARDELLQIIDHVADAVDSTLDALHTPSPA
jgi:hypothetical protein